MDKRDWDFNNPNRSLFTATVCYCKRCGAMVHKDDIELHDRWHDELGEMDSALNYLTTKVEEETT